MMMRMIHSGLLSPFARLQAMQSTFSWSVRCESSGCFGSIITWFQLNLKFTKPRSKKKRSLVFGTSHANRLRKYQGNKAACVCCFFFSHFFFLKFSSSHSWYRFCTRWCKQTAQTMCTQLNTPFTVVLCACGYGCVVLLQLALISSALFYTLFLCLWSNLLWILWVFFSHDIKITRTKWFQF